MSSLREALRAAAGGATRAAARPIRRIVPRNSSLYAWLQLLRSHLPAARKASRVERMLRGLRRQYPAATFLQIGSNDGSNLDPLRACILTSRWRGVLVEPVPYLYARLRANYPHAGRRLKFANVAIGDEPGEHPFYYLRPDADASHLPPWYETLGSFSRGVVLKHRDRIPDIEQRIVCEPVTCVTFEDLCREHGITALDLLHVDAEGFDYRILRQVDFARLRPRIVLYEHHHLSTADRIACRDMLAAQGYRGFEEGLDTLCLRHTDVAERDRPLVELWQALVPTGPQS